METQQEIVEEMPEVDAQESSTSNDTVDEMPSDQEANTNENLESSESEEVISEELEQHYSKGAEKRIQQLLADKHDVLNKLQNAYAKLNEYEGHNRNPATSQFQQPAQHDPRLIPGSPEFDFEAYTDYKLEQKMEERFRKETQRQQAETVLSDYQKVEQSIQQAAIRDPNFAHQWEVYGNLLTPDMKYSLAEMQSPIAFLKHIFKNEKDVRALQNLGLKHPSEQVRRFTAQGLSFERDTVAKRGVSSTPRKSTPIPQLGKRGTTTPFDNGYNNQNKTWDPAFIKRFMS